MARHAAVAAAVLLCALAVLPTALSQPAAAPSVQPGDETAGLAAPAPEPGGSLLAANRSIPLFPGQDSVRVALTQGGEYFSNCDEYGGDPANLTGADVAIARQLLRHMGIAEEYVTWVCFIDASTDGLAEAMARNEIDLFPLTTKNEGYIKAYGGLNWGPIIDSGYSAALVRAIPPGAATDSWSLLDAFSPGLWLALLGTMVVVGLLTFLAEVSTQNLHADRDSGLAQMLDALGRFTQARDMVAFSNASSVMVLAFSFLCFILSSLLTATMASRLTAGKLRTGITSMEDLAGRRVAMGDYELQFAAEFGLPFDTVLAYQYPWDAYYDGSWHATILPGLLAQLRAGDVDALIIGGEDVPKAVGQSCDLVVLPFFSYTYYAPLMRPGASPEAVRALNAAAVRMMYDGSHAAIQDKYYGTRDVPPCSRTSYKTSVAVTWDEVSSLWILLGAAAGISFLLVLRHLWSNRWWPGLRERQWVRTHLLREGKGGCKLGSPTKLLSSAVHAIEAATLPYQSHVDELPLTNSDLQPCEAMEGCGKGGKDSDGSSLDNTEPAASLQAAGGGNQASEERRANEDRREAAHVALPSQLQTATVGEVARNYSRLTSAQNIIVSRLLRRLRARTYHA